MANITLRIKKKYFDLILDGQKTIEYRAQKFYYTRMFQRGDDIKTLTLHYQSPRKLRADVVSIRLIETPLWILEDGSFDIGPFCYAIALINPKLI